MRITPRTNVAVHTIEQQATAKYLLHFTIGLIIKMISYLVKDSKFIEFEMVNFGAWSIDVC